ncbi:thioredoxin [Candidatus Microgenomates bacterium]|nr:thioredoxin [Candidatus Microgenomates bacterium]
MQLTTTNFEKEVLENKIPVLVDFYSSWCPPCKMLAPIIEELAKELKGEIKVGKLNIDQAREIAGKYGVMSIPTLILFKNGKEEKRIVGLRSKEEILKEIRI